MNRSKIFGKIIEFKKWYADLSAQEETQESEGLTIIKNTGCTACHSLDGSKLVGPSFKGLFGSDNIVITDGDEHEITVDEGYIKTSIYEPDKDIVNGYNKGLMQSYKKILSEEDVKKIIDFLKEYK